MFNFSSRLIFFFLLPLHPLFTYLCIFHCRQTLVELQSSSVLTPCLCCPVPPGFSALKTQPQGSHMLTSISATLQSYTRKNREGSKCSEKLLYSPTQTVKPAKRNIKNKWEESGFSHSYSFYRRLCLLQINVRWSKKPLHDIKSSSVSESCHQSTAQCQGAISWSDVRLYLWEREKEKQRH